MYNPDCFELHHTHCRNKRVAIAIKKNVERRRVPTSRNLRTLESHIRLTGNKNYKRKIQNIIEEVKSEMKIDHFVKNANWSIFCIKNCTLRIKNAIKRFKTRKSVVRKEET